MPDYVIPDSTASETLHKLPREKSKPKENQATAHVSCTHSSDQYCDVVKAALEKKISEFEPEFLTMPEHERIRPDEKTLIKLNNVTSHEKLKNIARITSEVNCVRKVRVLLKS